MGGLYCATTSATSARRSELPPDNNTVNTASASEAGDMPRRVKRVCVTWPHGAIVLDLEPRGPLPTEIYWRQGPALGTRSFVAGSRVVTAFVDSKAPVPNRSGADKPASAQSHPGCRHLAPQPAGQTRPLPRPRRNKTPGDFTPTAAGAAAAGAQGRDDCPDSTCWPSVI